MKLYIAGPMRGIKWYNFPAFDKVRDRLIAAGYEVVSPADLDRAEGIDAMDLPEDYDWNKLPPGMELKHIIIRDLTAMLECDALAMLDGWTDSSGAWAESQVAFWYGLIFRMVDEWESEVVV